ncbi:DNA polymerase, partial [Fasciola gigantica]
KERHSTKSQSVSKKARLNPDIRASETAPLRPAVGRDIRSLFAATAAQPTTKRPSSLYDVNNNEVEQNSVPAKLSSVVNEEACLMGMNFDEDFEQPEKPSSTSDHGTNKKFDKLSVPRIDSLNSTPLHAPIKSKCPASWLAAEEAPDDPTLDIKWSEDEENAPLFPTADGTSVHFYWFDAYEDMRLQPGVVYLFGKVKDSSRSDVFHSCCVRVKDLERRLFLLPRTDETDSGPTMKEVYTEFRALTAEHKIPKFRCKTSTKRYAFEFADVPVEADYLEVRYPANFPALPSDLQGKTFSHVFGTNTSFLENLILELQLRGPCWLILKNAVLAPPKDAALPYDLRTKLPSFGAQYSPPAATWLASSTNGDGDGGETVKPSPVRRSTLKPDLGRGGGVDVESNERALLGRFLTRLHKLDPDLIIGHDLWGHQIELLVQRLQANKVAHWHRIGRLRRSAQFAINANSRGWLIRNALPGRLVCDTRVSARELVRSRTYNLSDLAHQILADVRSDNLGSATAQRQIPVPITQRLCGGSADLKRPPLEGDAVQVVGVELADLEIDSFDLRCLFVTSDLVRQLIDFCLSDAHLVLRLAHQLQVLPLAMQITSICGNVLSRTLSGGRAERNEALLLHAFTQRGYIVPDPVGMTRRPGRLTAPAAADDWGDAVDHRDSADAEERRRRKPAYTGGLVLEPKKGFYDKYILLLDFNSLYPSIIQEFNICFTTVDRELVTGRKSIGDARENDSEHQTGESPDLDAMVAALLSTVQGSNTTSATGSPLESQLRLPTTQTPGLLPAEIRRLVESRREVKKLIASASAPGNAPCDPAQLAQWNTRQAALKLTANSVYGCLGYNASRFCARGLAALVTGLGRAVLMNTRDLVENMNLEVIYGDTDSIMVNTNTTDLLAALSIGEKVRQEVNKHYRLLELDTDGVYAAMLLLAKKKYAALAIVSPIQWAQGYRSAQAQSTKVPVALPPAPATKQEMKGLDIVRRDWSALAVTVGKRCVAALLSGESKDVILDRIHTDLTETAERVRSGQLPVSDFIITKASEYLFTYIIFSLCAHDVSRRVTQTENDNIGAGSESTGFAGVSAWADADPLIVDCPRKCGGPPITIRSSAFGSSAKSWACANCSFNLLQSAEAVCMIVNHLIMQARQLILRYELGWLVCEDPACGLITRSVPCPPGSTHTGADVDGLWARGGRPLCPACGGQALLKPKYSESRLYRQLCFFRHLVSPSTAASETEGLLSATYGQTPDLVQLCNTTPPRCLSGELQQLSHSNSYDFDALTTSPWVQQYRSMCAEFGRDVFSSEHDPTVCTYPLSDDVRSVSRKPVSGGTHSNSVGQKVVSFLRGAFRRTSDDTVQDLRSPHSEKHQASSKHNKKLECLVSHKGWRTSTTWIGRHKDSQTNSQASKTLNTNKQLFAVRHSGSRSAESFKNRISSPVYRSRDASSAPLDQSNSQNSTPTPRPSALITARSSSDKSREGAAKRTRFSLHPSTCNAPPDLIRRRRDGDDTGISLSVTVDNSTKPGRGNNGLGNTSECVAKRCDSDAPFTPKHVGDVSSYPLELESKSSKGKSEAIVRKSVVSNTKENGKLGAQLSHQKISGNAYCSHQERVNPVSPRTLVNGKTEQSAPQSRSTNSTSNQKRSSVSSQPVSTPVVTVAPMAKVLPRRANSSSATPERKRVTFETPTVHSVPSTPTSSLDLDSSRTNRKSSLGPAMRHLSEETNERIQGLPTAEDPTKKLPMSEEKVGKFPQLVPDRSSGTSITTRKLDSKLASATRHRACRFRRYRRLISDLNQIYRNYAAPYDLTRELTDEICQAEITHIVRSLLNEELKHEVPLSELNKSTVNKTPNAPKEETYKKLTETPNTEVSNLNKRDITMGITEHRKAMDLDEWFGLKPIFREDKETRLGVILSNAPSTARDRRSLLEPMDTLPTRDLNDSVPRSFHGPRDPDSLQSSVNTYVKKVRSTPSSILHRTNDFSQREQEQTEKPSELYSVHQITFESEEAPNLELRSQQLTETMEDHFSSEMEFSDECNITYPSLSSKEIRLSHLVHSPTIDFKSRSAKAEQPVTLICHSAQTRLPASLALNRSQSQVSEPRCMGLESVHSKPTSLETDKLTVDQNRNECANAVEHNLLVTPIHVEDSSEQKRTTESDELSTTHLWNQIHQSLVELTSLSDEGIRTTPERATATVRLERASSSVARSDTVDSLSPCLSRMGPPFNPDVTVLSEPSISTISIPDDNSSIPWTRARVVVLRDSVNQSVDATPTAILVRRQVSHASCQTEISSAMSEQELRNKSYTPMSNDTDRIMSSCSCHLIGPCSVCGAIDIAASRRSASVTSRGETWPEASRNPCPRCSGRNSLNTPNSPALFSHTEAAIQTDTDQTTMVLDAVPNVGSTTISGIPSHTDSRLQNKENRYPIYIPGNKEVLKSHALSDCIPQVRDVGDCVQRQSSIWDSTLQSRFKSKSSAVSGGSLDVNSRSYLDVHSRSGRHEAGAFSPSAYILKNNITPSRHTRVGHNQRPGGKTTRTWLRQPQVETDASSGDSRLISSMTPCHRSHTNYTCRHGRPNQNAYAKYRSRDPDSELSDAEGSSSVSSTRHGYPPRKHLGCRTRSNKSVSQPPTFEMVRLDERRSRMPFLPTRLSARHLSRNELKTRELKTPHELLLELREMKKQYSAPHLTRSLYTRHSSASSSSQHVSGKAVPFYTPPATTYSSKRRTFAAKLDADSSRTESESGGLRRTGLRRVNRYKTQSVRSYPSTSPHPVHRTRSTCIFTPQLESSANLTTRKRITRLSSAREDFSRSQPHVTGSPYSQTASKSLREPLIRRTHPSFNRPNRSWCKPEPFLCQFTEIRPVDDSLLRHTFASLQKVRNKARPVVSPTVSGRPPMIFKR